MWICIVRNLRWIPLIPSNCRFRDWVRTPCIASRRLPIASPNDLPRVAAKQLATGSVPAKAFRPACVRKAASQTLTSGRRGCDAKRLAATAASESEACGGGDKQAEK